MKKLTVVLAVLMTLSAVAQTTSPNPFASVRGIPFGASEQEAKIALPDLNCFGGLENPRGNLLTADIECSRNGSIGEVETNETYFFLSGDKFTSIAMMFATGSYASMRETFIIKYGSPPLPLRDR